MGINPIGSLRGICALMIVWHHMATAIGAEYHFDFGNTIVLFFFMLSGFHITLTWKDKINGNITDFYIRRASKVYPIQWLTCSFFVFTGINFVSGWAIPFHFLCLQSLSPFWEINFTLNYPSWFLSSILVCYILTPLIFKTISHLSLWKWIIIYSFLVVSYSVMVFALPESVGTRWLCYINPCARLLDYLTGVTLAIFYKNVQEKGIKLEGSYRSTFFEIFFLTTVVAFMTYPVLFEYNNYSVLRYPFVAGMILVFTYGKGYISRCISNRIMYFLGSISLSIYMTHMIVLEFLKDINLSVWASAIIGYAVIIALAFVVDQYILPPFTRIFIWLVGNTVAKFSQREAINSAS